MATPRFNYKALDQQGAPVSGVVTAGDEKGAFDQLSARGLSPWEIKPAGNPASLVALPKRKITKKDLARYMRQLATLLSANVTILDALTTLAQSEGHRSLSDRTKAIRSDLRAGKNVSRSLEERIPELPIYVFRLAELGEATGSLSKALNDAVDRMEYEEAMRSEVRSALTYPAFLITVGSAIVILMFIFVVPRFSTLLGDDISAAPWLSRQVIGFGVWLQANWLLALGAAAGAVVGVSFVMRNNAAKQFVRTQMERMPIVGPFLEQAEVGAWARTVGVAVQNKAKLIDALRLGEAGAQSARFRRDLEVVRRSVRAGQPLEEALHDAHREIDPIVVDLIRTGRSAGALGEMLVFAANIYEKDARERAKRLMALTEPVAILMIALLVGGIVISIVMAMTSLYQFDV